MARLTTDERLSRLQRRLDELVKPFALIGKSFASGIEATTTLSNGKQEQRHFKSREVFDAYAATLKDCNIILDNKIMACGGETLRAAVAAADTEDIRLLADITEITPEVQDAFNRVIVNDIMAQIS